MTIGNTDISDAAIRAACAKWRIRRMEIFGSARTGDLGPDSDVDLLVEFEPQEQWSLMDLVRAEEELALLFGRRVELVDRNSLERSTNWIRREAILQSTEVLYGA